MKCKLKKTLTNIDLAASRHVPCVLCHCMTHCVCTSLAERAEEATRLLQDRDTIYVMNNTNRPREWLTAFPGTLLASWPANNHSDWSRAAVSLSASAHLCVLSSSVLWMISWFTITLNRVFNCGSANNTGTHVTSVFLKLLCLQDWREGDVPNRVPSLKCSFC